MSGFVLDQNFPSAVVPLPWPPSVQIIPLAKLAPQLTAGTEDWEIFIALDAEPEVHAFVTNDGNILNSPREMLVLSLTRLGTVVTAEVGDNPMKATGLLMVHLPEISHELGAKAKTWRLRPTSKLSQRPIEQLARIARLRNLSLDDLIVSEVEALRDLLPEPYRRRLLAQWGDPEKVAAMVASLSQVEDS